jgi:argininosuccinate synthase
MTRIILAYSGGLASSAAIPWLLEQRPGAQIIAVIVDLGARSELVEARERALALGVVRCHVVDAREQLVRSCILPALQAGALFAHRSPLLSALGRSVVAKTLVDLARMESADAIAFADDATERASVAGLVRTLDPSVERIPYAWTGGEPGAAEDPPRRIVTNIWGRSVAMDPDVDAGLEVSEDVYTLTRAPKEAPNQPAYLDIEFDKGLPVRVNGIEMLLLEMLESLETIAGAHGVGRTDAILSHGDGTTYREIAEAPAGLLLQMAHRELQELVASPALNQLTLALGAAYRALIETGNWFSDTRRALDAFTASIQSKVTGSIRLRLFKGDCRVVGRGLHQAGQSISGTPLVRTV